MLILGVNTGGDLFLFRWYFGPGVKIYGVDINEECKAFGEEDDIQVFIGDQGNKEFLAGVLQKIGEPLDIVLDDASHTSWLTIKSIEVGVPIRIEEVAPLICGERGWTS